MKFVFLTIIMFDVSLVPLMLAYNLHRSYRLLLLVGDVGTRICQTPYVN